MFGWNKCKLSFHDGVRQQNKRLDNSSCRVCVEVRSLKISWSPEISPEWTYWMTIFDCQNNQPYHVFGYRRKTAIVTSTSASKFLWQILRIKIVTQFAELWAFKHNTFRSRLWVHENLGYSPKDWKNPRKHQSLGSENNPASSFVNITKLSVLHNQLKSQV